MDHKSNRDEELTRLGWTRRFSASEPRLTEAAEQYRELGLEVLLEPVNVCPADGSCTSCFGQSPEMLKIIYTRPGREED